MIAQQTATVLTHLQQSTAGKVATMHTCSQYKPSRCVYWTDRRRCASGPSPSLSPRDRLPQEMLAPQVHHATSKLPAFYSSRIPCSLCLQSWSYAPEVSLADTEMHTHSDNGRHSHNGEWWPSNQSTFFKKRFSPYNLNVTYSLF